MGGLLWCNKVCIVVELENRQNKRNGLHASRNVNGNAFQRAAFARSPGLEQIELVRVAYGRVLRNNQRLILSKVWPHYSLLRKAALHPQP